MLRVTVRPRHLFLVLLGAAVVLSALSYLFLLLTVAFGVDAGAVVSARKFVDVNAETNLPSWYSAVLLTVTGLVTFEVGRQALVEGRRWAWHWMVLGAGFCYLSLDELVALHERFVGPMTAVVGDSGVFKYAWVAAALPAVVLVALFYAGSCWPCPAAPRRSCCWPARCTSAGPSAWRWWRTRLSDSGFSEQACCSGRCRPSRRPARWSARRCSSPWSPGCRSRPGRST